MKKATVEKIRTEFLGKEINFYNLDNYMSENGYYSVFDDGAIEDIKADKNVVYTGLDTNECEVIIEFEITIDSSEDEAEENFDLKVISVEKF
ncbi:MAG: hypothetical protein ACLR02_09730 [Clostridium sp.]